MSKLVKLALVSSCLVLSTQAIANNGFYLGGKLGTSFISANDVSYTDDDLFDNYVISNDWGSKTKNGFNLGVVVGYDFNPTYQVPVRLEFDYTFRPETKISQFADGYVNGQLDSDESMGMKTKVTLHTTMMNAYYDFHNSSDITPYLGAGLGLALIDAKFTSSFYDDEDGDITGGISKSKANFAWSLNAGVSYKINDSFTADLGYRYLDAGKITNTSSTLGIGQEKFSAKFATHDVTVGLRYSF